MSLKLTKYKTFSENDGLPMVNWHDVSTYNGLKIGSD
jgi:hypothetical protein